MSSLLYETNRTYLQSKLRKSDETLNWKCSYSKTTAVLVTFNYSALGTAHVNNNDCTTVCYLRLSVEKLLWWPEGFRKQDVSLVLTVRW